MYSAVVDTQRLDHCMSIIWFSTQLIRESQITPSLSFNIDYDKLASFLDIQDWSDIFTSQKLSLAFDKFQANLVKHIEPSKVLAYSKQLNVTKLKPWISDSICYRIKQINLSK